MYTLFLTRTISKCERVITRESFEGRSHPLMTLPNLNVYLIWFIKLS